MSRPIANCVVDTDPLLSYFGITASVGVTVGYLFAYLAVVHMLTYLALRWAVVSPSVAPRGGVGWVGCFRRSVCQLGSATKTKNEQDNHDDGLWAAGVSRSI